ncbi:MAG: hypothetical protein IPO60_10605 [Flavobacteriales bacterium]|nr:hypothetical protein [Flavobacteriales bacterium]
MNAKNAKGTGTPKRKGARNSERTVKKDPEPGGWDAPILEWDATIPDWDATIPDMIRWTECLGMKRNDNNGNSVKTAVEHRWNNGGTTVELRWN